VLLANYQIFSFRMAEESAAPSTSTDKTESMDVDGEAKKLLGLGQKNLVMGDIPAAVNAFQEAASLLGKKYGETANECAEAFFFYGKSLLELARMENGVLGNALEGVQVEEEEEKAEDSMVESADNIDEEAREELREQVYNAMGEKEESRNTAEEFVAQTEAGTLLKNKDAEMKEIKEEKVKQEAMDVERATPKEDKEEQEKAEKQVEMAEEKKEGASEVAAEVDLDNATMEDKPVAAEDTAGNEKPAAAEEAGEDATVKNVVAEKESTGEEKPAATEAPGEVVAVEKKPVAVEETSGQEKPIEAGVLEKMEEAAEELIDLAAEKQAETTVETTVEKHPVGEELVKASSEAVEEKELVTAVEEIKGEIVPTVEKEEEPAIKKMEEVETGTEQVMDSKEKEELKEPLNLREIVSSDANEITPAGGTEPSNEVHTEEKAESAKVEKEEEKDDEMGEGEETEGSEDDDKVDEERENENDTTVEEKESEEDEVGNLELAWDMLELAKVIYKRQDTKEAQLHAAQAHLKLGEVSIESENYSQAIEEFHSCLTLQQKYLEAHDRLLAETHYHLGLAYHYNNQYDEAVLQFSKSMDVIDKRMVMLTERLKAKGEGLSDEKEIEELKGLLPEIKEKIEDSKESQKSARVAELALKATLVGGSSSSFSQGTESSLTSTVPVGQTADGASQCITDISHLVRKKRKPEEETQQGDNEAKKSKPEPAVNGGGDAAPSGNEIAEKMEEEVGS
ncbi:hypothetical protein lerEdw1_018776, partial [Lerista edwardsae]